MFIAAEFGEWLRVAGFAEAAFFGGTSEPLTAQGRRRIAVAQLP